MTMKMTFKEFVWILAFCIVGILSFPITIPLNFILYVKNKFTTKKIPTYGEIRESGKSSEEFYKELHQKAKELGYSLDIF